MADTDGYMTDTDGFTAPGHLIDAYALPDGGSLIISVPYDGREYYLSILYTSGSGEVISTGEIMPCRQSLPTRYKTEIYAGMLHVFVGWEEGPIYWTTWALPGDLTETLFAPVICREAPR
jgi:hypothetical protein